VEMHDMRPAGLSFKRSILWFRLWLLFNKPKPQRCERCVAMGGNRHRHLACFEPGCHCRCSRVEGYQP